VNVARRTGNGKAALHIVFRQLEGKLLGVVVDDLRLVQQQRDKALLAASEGLLRGSSGLAGDLLCLFRWRRLAFLA
jgi:hypothetical protein